MAMVRKAHLKYVIDNLDSLVVKEVHGSGGYGMLIGPKSTKKKIEFFKKKILQNPNKYIAQPTLELSTVPILTNQGLSSRHIDLRPFVLVSPKSIKSFNLSKIDMAIYRLSFSI